MKRIILVDGNSLMYRAYFGMAAVGNIRPNSKGVYTNAIFAFARMINNLINSDYDNILVAFDKGKHTFRHDIMSDYKAGRASMPDEMRMQIAHIKEFLNIMNIKQFEIDLYEADDIIGTVSKMALDEGYHVDIYSSDKDLLQLISNNSTVHLTKTGMSVLEDYTPEYFFNRYEINVDQFIDLKAMMGDKSDNLPGIVGVGEKTAVKLLKEYGSLENIIKNADSIKGSLGEKVRAYKEEAIVTKKMVTILRDAPLGISLDDTVKRDKDYDRLKHFYEELELNSLLKEMSLDKKQAQIEKNETYEIVNNIDKLKEILVPYSTFYIEAMEENYHKANILAFGLKNHKGNYIINLDLLNTMDMMLFLNDNENHKMTFDVKRMSVMLKNYGINLRGVDFDLMLASYIINPIIGNAEFKNICNYFGYNDVFYEEEIYGKGAKRKVPERQEDIYAHTIKKCNAIHILKNNIISRLDEKNQLDLYNEIELPLALVLASMEYEGVKVDIDELNRQDKNLIERIQVLEGEIYELAGEKFNIQSPKQLGVVLFEHMGIYAPKKTKSGYSTDAETLSKIIGNHPIISKILDYRGLAKLKSTYIDGIRDVLYKDNLVHTIYQQALTQTGRLSSIEPNLQNIPIRTEDGKEIRKVFIPKNDKFVFFSADYSQVELRVLAHLANVKKLIEAFNNGEDIHTRTAKEIFGHDDITPNERRKAKAVNFGIIYGISAFGLASDVGITNTEASNYIKKYYEIYPEIKEYMDNIIEECKKNGYVKTIKNRYRYIPDINSNVYMVREFAKRTAMNAPIQGSAADIMKIAMIKIYNKLESERLNSKMICQVHDEVLIEVYKGEEDKIVEIVKESMEHAIKLSVPLDIDYSFGDNWYNVK